MARHCLFWTLCWLAIYAAELSPAGVAEEIRGLDDPAQLHGQWPEPKQAEGVSVRLPETATFGWPIDRAVRELVMDREGNGGSLYTSGDFGGPPGHVGLKVAFVGGTERVLDGKSTVNYLGGDGPGQDAPGRLLRMNSIHFRHAPCETGPNAAHRLVLQSDVELVVQEQAARWNPPHLRIYGGLDMDIRELALAGHRLGLLGATLSTPHNAGIITYAGIDFGGGVLEFQDAIRGEEVDAAGFSDDGYLSRPEPTGVPRGFPNLYLRGPGTLRWQTLAQQCLSPGNPHTFGPRMGPLSRWDTTTLRVEIGNNRFREGVSDWEVWSDGSRLAIGAMQVGGEHPGSIRLVDRRPSLLENGGEVLRVRELDVAANGRVDCNGISIVCDHLTIHGRQIEPGLHAAATLGPGLIDASGIATVRVGPPADQPPTAVATARITLPSAGLVSVGIFNPDGQLIRNLHFGDRREPGDMWIAWDGLDEQGRPLPPGSYEWRALSRPGFRASLVANLGTNHPEGVTRCWGGNHGGPETVACDDQGIFIGFPGSEFTGQLIAIRPDGGRRWSLTWKDEHGFGPEAIATDGAGRLAVVQYTHGRDDYLHLSVADAATGKKLGRFKLSLPPVAKQWARRLNLDIAARDAVAIITDRVNDRLVWFSLTDGSELASQELDDPGSVTVDGVGRWWLLAKDGVYHCETGATPARAWPDLALDQPRAIAWDAAAGNFLVVEGGTEQVLRVSREGNVVARFGRRGGRAAGPWNPDDFRGLHDVAADGQGGFVTVELGHGKAAGREIPRPAVNRTARFDAQGRMQREWFGGQRWSHNVALDPEDPTLATIEGGPGMVCLVRIDAATQSWRMLESFREPLSEGLVMSVNQRGWQLARRGGKLWLYRADPTAGVAVYELDRAAGTLIPRATSGRMSLFKADTRPSILREALEQQPKEIQRLPDYQLAFHWSDDDADGIIEAAEFAFFVWPFAYGSRIDVGSDWLLTASSPEREYAWITLANQRAADPAALPRWDFSSPTPASAVYPEVCQDPELFPRLGTDGPCRDAAGNIYEMVGGNGYANEDRQGEFWPEGYGAVTRIVRWDPAGVPQWAVGRHIGGRGRYTCGYGLLGVAHGCIVTRDRYGGRLMTAGEPLEPTLLWSEEGLYAGNLMEAIVGFDHVPWIDYWSDHVDSPLEFDQHFNGLWTYSDGSVYYAMQGRSATPLFKIEGWNDWTRLKGPIVLAAKPHAASGTGSGLRGEYFANAEWQGEPAVVRDDARIWFEMDPKLTGGLIPAHWGDGAPAEGVPADNFTVRWTGELEPRFSEDYQLIVEGDVESAVRIWIGDRLVLEDDGVSGRRAQRFGGGYVCRRSHSVPLPLEAGTRVPIKIEYRHGKGQAGIHLMWQSRTQDRQHVPTRFLFPAAAAL
jgi:hypothetical protein